MKYGTYKISLSIGYSQSDRGDVLNISDYVAEKDWNNMTEDEQEAWIDEAIGDILGQYIEYGCKLVD